MNVLQARGMGTEVTFEDCRIEKSSGYGVLVRNCATVNLLHGCVVNGNGHASQTETAIGGEDPGTLTIHPTAKISGVGVRGNGR